MQIALALVQICHQSSDPPGNMLQESRRCGKNRTTAIIQLLWEDKRRPRIPSVAIKLSVEKLGGILLPPYFPEVFCGSLSFAARPTGTCWQNPYVRG